MLKRAVIVAAATYASAKFFADVAASGVNSGPMEGVAAFEAAPNRLLIRAYPVSERRGKGPQSRCQVREVWGGTVEQIRRNNRASTWLRYSKSIIGDSGKLGGIWSAGGVTCQAEPSDTQTLHTGVQAGIACAASCRTSAAKMSALLARADLDSTAGECVSGPGNRIDDWHTFRVVFAVEGVFIGTLKVSAATLQEPLGRTFF
jgi:hypothetical protein